MAKHDVHIVVGPTASGKSAFALDLAQRHNGVVINCDSMQIYDGLPLLSAQPSPDDKDIVPHYLYGTLHPNDPCSAGLWQRMAAPLIDTAISNGQTPIICGGTGLYVKALTEGLSPIPNIPDTVRADTMKLFDTLGSAELYKKLQDRDPSMIGRFHDNHSARIIRAWEVLEATGKSLSYWQDQPRVPPPSHWQFVTHKIMPDRDVLYQRCNQRFDMMLNHGAIEEVKDFRQRMIDEHIAPNALLTKALGFAPLCDYLDNRQSLDDATEQAKQDTRRYAKRQSTWFNNQL